MGLKILYLMVSETCATEEPQPMTIYIIKLENAVCNRLIQTLITIIRVVK